MKKRIKCISSIVFSLSLTGCKTKGAFLYEPERPDSWPTEDWPTSTPEEQGMNSENLLKMIEVFSRKKQAKEEKGEKAFIDSITVVRNGHIVADIYLNPLFPPETKHIIHSCTKSVISILVGIAIEKGHIQGVDVPVVEIFSEKKIDNLDEKKQAMTIRDLLTMQTGLHSQDSYLFKWKGLFKMMDTENWTDYILNLPMDVEPGTRFDYSNMSSYLLSAILEKTTGTDTLSFAKANLFAPLGINDIYWEKSPEGKYIGWARMWLKPRDMAKIGLLYLQKGRWEERQIVPVHWVEESTKPQSFPGNYRYFMNDDGSVDYKLSTGLWVFTNLFRPFSRGYGYQWWIDKNGMYTALGFSGQYITVIPEKNMVVVFTSKLTGRDSFIPVTLLKDYILPAVESDTAIAPNETAQNRLIQFAKTPAATEKRRALPDLAKTASRISGKTFSLEANPWKYDSFKLVFTPEQDFAEFTYTKRNTPERVRVGLDNTHQLLKSGESVFAAKGSWISEDTFVIDYEIVGFSGVGKWTLTFQENEITVEEVGVTGQYTYSGIMEK